MGKWEGGKVGRGSRPAATPVAPSISRWIRPVRGPAATFVGWIAGWESKVVKVVMSARVLNERLGYRTYSGVAGRGRGASGPGPQSLQWIVGCLESGVKRSRGGGHY